MPDIQLFMTASDEAAFISFILQTSCIIVPDLNYEEPLYREIREKGEYAEVRSKTRLFFVIDKRMLNAPFEMRALQKDGKRVFYINPLAGGAKMQFLGSGIFQEDGHDFIRPGFLALDTRYWNTKTQETQEAPAEFLTVYKLLRRHITDTFTRMRLRKTTVWLAPEAYAATRSGAKLVGFESFDLSLPQSEST